LIAECSTAEFIQRAGGATVKARGPQLAQFSETTHQGRCSGRSAGRGRIVDVGPDSSAVSEPAAANGVVLHELSPQAGSLEEAFLQLTGDVVEYHAQSAAG
jgi:ABC-2 type transport system ATP-binding protein